LIYYIVLGGTVLTFTGSGEAGFLDGDKNSVQFNAPSGIAKYYKENTFFVTDCKNHRIRKISSTGVVSVFAGNGTASSVDGMGTNASFNYPYGIAIDQRNGDVYISDRDGNKIRKITQQGQVQTIAGNHLFSRPSGLCFSSAEECLYLADQYKHRIRKIDITSGKTTTLAGTGSSGYVDGDGTTAKFSQPCGVVLLGTSLLVADTCNHRIRRINMTGSKAYVGTLAGSGEKGCKDGELLSARFNLPFSVCVDEDAQVCYVADVGNNKIRSVSLS